MSKPPINLAGILDALNYTDAEFVQLCQEGGGAPFSSVVYPADYAAGLAEQLPQDRNVWFSPNPTSGPARSNAGRGGAAQVTRLAALWIDLDIKPGACPNLATAETIVADAVHILGVDPIAITHSGHGLQPIWAVENGEIDHYPDNLTTPQAAALLRRWGRLIGAIGDRRNVKIDALWDLPRILRAPGTINHKSAPVPVHADTGGGAPIDVDRLREILTEYGIPELDDDGTDPGVILSAPTEWEWSRRVSCAYARHLIAGWQTDHPQARHPWLTAQAVRLAAMHRNGCLTANDHAQAERALADRFTALVEAAGDRPITPGEIRGAIGWGILTAATFTDKHLAGELGNHQHTTAPPEPPPVENARLTPTGPILDPRLGIDGSTATVLEFPTDRAGKIDAINLTDQGNADLLADRHNHRLRYAPSRNAWLTWNGTRWAESPDNGEAIQAAIETIRAIRPHDDATKKHQHASLSRRALTAAVELAGTHPTMRVAADDLDAYPEHLNTPGGIVDLTTGDLQPCQPNRLHTHITGAEYDPKMGAPLFQRFLDETFQEHPELRAYVQRLAGYSALGMVTHHVLPFLHGAGGNGKTVLLDILQGVLGTYASTAPLGFLLAGSRDDESAIARLQGLRLVVASEVGSAARFDEAKVKQLTGGDRLTARHLYARHFTFKPSHTLWLAGNHQPRVDAGGESFWRRLRLIPFEHTVPKEERVPGLAERIIADEAPAVLAWIVDGAVDVTRRRTLDEPQIVTEATARYAEEEDALARFVGECLVIGGGEHVRVEAGKIRETYEAWCRDEGEKPANAQAFGRELRTRWGLTTRVSHGRRFYSNLAPVVSDAAPWETR